MQFRSEEECRMWGWVLGQCLKHNGDVTLAITAADSAVLARRQRMLFASEDKE